MAATAFQYIRNATDWGRDHHTLQDILNLDLNLRREELKEALLDYEDTHPGNNLVGSKVYEFLRHCQNIIWKQLAVLAVENPAEYAAWKNGERGHWPLQTNNVAHGMLLRLSEGRRAQLHEPGAAIERTKSGMPVISDNIRRTVQNWRRKTTAAWVTQSGDTINGFPFFLSWTRLNRAGEPDPKGRGNVIGMVDMRWIFGPEWAEAGGENASDNEPNAAEQREKFSTIPQHLIKSGKKNEGSRLSAKAEDVFNKSAEPTDQILKTAHKHGTLQGASVQENDEKNIAPGAANGGGGGMSRAAALWQFLLTRIYLPLLGTGRIRYNSENACLKGFISSYTAEKCGKLLVENLHSARNTGEITLAEAEKRLLEAIEKQAKYLEDNPEAWILVPDKFLRTDKAHGTLLSALRLLVKENHAPSMPPNPPNIQEDESERDKKNRLYDHLLSLGAHRIHPGTFSRWYSQYGPQKLEACMVYMAQQAARRREKGKPKGREFDSNKGGASAYFASLITRFDSKAIEREIEMAERSKLKQDIWKYADEIKAGKSTPELDRIKEEMFAIHARLSNDQDFSDAAIRDTNAFFQSRLVLEDFLRGLHAHKYVAMIQYVLQLQNSSR